MRLFRYGCLLSAAAALPAQLAGQRAPAEPEIVVEGSRRQDRQIKDFIGALTDAPVRGQISRFDWAVCPAAMGLAPSKNQAVVDRMRQVAGAAGIPVAKANCTPNVLVVVTPDKKAFVRQLQKLYPAYFTDISTGAVRNLVESPGPAAAWHVKGRLTADGTEVARDPVTGYYVNEVTDTPSRITTSTRPHFMASVVVVELNSLAGLSTTQFADYAALRAFAETDPRRLTKSQAPTILTILDQPMDSQVPLSLTQWDLSFLKSLYGSSGNHYANSQRGEMKRIFKKDLQGAQQGEN